MNESPPAPKRVLVLNAGRRSESLVSEYRVVIDEIRATVSSMIFVTNRIEAGPLKTKFDRTNLPKNNRTKRNRWR